MSGHCDFCGIWHSSSCFHPGRAKLDTLERENARLQARVEELEKGLRGMTGRCWKPNGPCTVLEVSRKLLEDK
jgi:hypothetical protein